MDANSIKNRDRWESEDGEYVIFEDDVGTFIVAQILSSGTNEWFFGFNSSHDLWFPSYASARKHLKDECFVESRFKKVKGA